MPNCLSRIMLILLFIFPHSYLVSFYLILSLLPTFFRILSRIRLSFYFHSLLLYLFHLLSPIIFHSDYVLSSTPFVSQSSSQYSSLSSVFSQTTHIHVSRERKIGERERGWGRERNNSDMCGTNSIMFMYEGEGEGSGRV